MEMAEAVEAEYGEELLYADGNSSKHGGNNYYWFIRCQNLTRIPDHKDNIEYLVPVTGEVHATEALTTTMSVLSILGCCLIIFTYIAYKDIRTRARAMLFHLSLADLVVNISLLVGLYLNFVRITEKLAKKGNGKSDFVFNSTNDPRCYTQAAVTIYGTVASLLWSNMIGIFMVILVVKQSKSQKINRVFYIMACFACWLLPLIIIIIDGASKKFGYVVMSSMGCYIFSTPKHHRRSYILAEIFSYDVWLFLTLLLLPILYSILFYYTHFRVKHKALKSWKGSPDVKLLLVPIIFVLTRIWSAIFRVALYYFGVPANPFRGCHILVEVMLVLEGIGANSQGTVNAILFCLLTRAVRTRIWKSCKKFYFCVCCCGRKKYTESVHSPGEDESLYVPATSYEALNS